MRGVVLALIVCAATCQDAVEKAAPPTYHVPSYDVNFPLREGSSDISNWILSGLAMVTPAGISLINEVTGQRGSMWNHVPITTDNFELEFHVEVRGPPEPKSADGFAFWFVDENDIGAFLRQPSPELWSLFGYRPNFRGFGTFFAVSDRANNPTPSISAAINDASLIWDVNTGIPSSDGIYYAFRNEGATKGSLVMNMQFTRDLVKGSVRWTNDSDHRAAFMVKTLGLLPKAGYIGLTASNRRIPKGETTLATGSATGDRITITKVRVSSPDLEWVSRTHIPGQHLLARILNEENLDTNSQMKLMSESMMKHVLPKQEHMVSEMSKLFQSHRLMSERIDILFAYLSNNEKLQQALDRLDNLRNVVFKSSRDQAQKIDALKDTLGHEELKQRSATLESTVKHHTQLASYLTIGLGAVFVAFGTIIYKRMRDMEKKHIL